MKFLVSVCVVLVNLFGVMAVAAEGSTSHKSFASVVGAWHAQVSFDQPGPAGFVSLMTIGRDFTFTESHDPYSLNSPVGPIMRTIGLGTWVPAGKGEIVVSYETLFEGAPNNPAFNGVPLGVGTIVVKAGLVSKNQLEGRFASEVRDPNGNILSVTQGTITAERITINRQLLEQLGD